jgi:hypothetical protein
MICDGVNINAIRFSCNNPVIIKQASMDEEKFFQISIAIFVWMYRYFIKTPWVINICFPPTVWSIRATEKEVY